MRLVGLTGKPKNEWVPEFKRRITPRLRDGLAMTLVLNKNITFEEYSR